MDLDEGDQAVLDELWDGGFLLPDSPLPEPVVAGAAGGDDAFALAAKRTFRCLDGSHAADCNLCTPPPTAREASRWELRGDPGCVPP